MTSEELLYDATAYDYAGDGMKGVLRKLEGEDVSFAVALQPRMVRGWVELCAVLYMEISST
jgi:hypothetical protein